jgi:hypothetical protein
VVAEGLTLIEAVVAPPVQTYVPPPLAVKSALAPAQIIPSLFVTPDVSVTAMDAEGSGFTVIVVLAVEVQPLVVTVTV